MFFKRFGVFVLGLICGVSLKAHAYIAPLSPQSFEQLYAYAAAGKVDILTNAVSRGMNIDSINSNGDTGLCVAAKRGNRRAYKSFLTAGANPSHECTWDIKGYREFMQSVISNPVKNLDTAAVAKYGATGMSWTTKALIGAGVVAAGGGAALAFSGGGGGSSSDPNCIHGYRNKDDACICHTGYDGPKCNDCATGYGHYGTSNCYPDIPDCGHGTQVGGGCKCDTGYAGPSCHACASGYGFDSTGVCVIQSADMLGNSVNRNYNKIGAIYLDSTTYQNVYGLFYDAEDTYGDRAPHLPQSTFVNAHEYLRDVDATSTIGSADMPVHNIGTNTESITINKNGSGHVYGMYSSTAENIYHNYLYLQSGIVIGTLNATTSITSKGDGNVYGMYGNGDLYGAYFDGIAGQYISDDDPPVTLYSNLHMNSTILASNIGSGAVYGMYNGSSTGTIYNMNSTQTYTDTDDIVHTLSQTTSSVMAANLDSGDAYGLYSKGEIYHSGTLTTTANTGNAYGMSAATSITALTSANVTSIDGKAVGMYGLGDGVFINANYLTVSSTNSDVYGAHLQKGGSFANGGQIKVTTTTGNAIGVYAHDVGMTNSWGTSNGALIVSTTTGDAYGVHMTGNSTLNNTSSIKAT
ncbi:MAG: hypothetical protein J6X42_04965, partial [Alphaproteobacteria bacterium]|nr:hypothetical protein [Alphaproteobacteria bacterium]